MANKYRYIVFRILALIGIVGWIYVFKLEQEILSGPKSPIAEKGLIVPYNSHGEIIYTTQKNLNNFRMYMAISFSLTLVGTAMGLKLKKTKNDN